MTSTKYRLAGLLGSAAGVAWAVTGFIQIAYGDEVRTGTMAETAEAHIMLAGLSVALLLTVPAMLALARHATRPTAAQVAAVGMVGLAILATISNVRGEDPSFFPPVAAVTNLMWLGGSIALAVSLKRAGRISKRLAYVLPVTWITAMPLSAIGGPIVTGADWLTVGYLMYHGALERRAARPVTA
jgi:hypothetical protein